MPEINHDKRRQKIAEIAVEVIAREGLEAATVRHIAAEAGYSTTVITHYFNNKDDLLLLAYRHISARAAERLAQVTAQKPGDILGALMSLTPLEETSRQGWRVYIAFWQKAGHDPEFAREQQRGIDFGLTQLETIIRRRIGNHPDIPRLARQLIALVHGIAIQQLFDPSCWTKEEIENAFSREIDLLLGQLTTDN